MSTISLSDWLLQRLDRRSAQPLYRQLHQSLRQAVLDGHLQARTRLPSTRLLARELGIARNTVIEVYDQLTIEGCVVSRRGSGTVVADLSAERVFSPPLSLANAAAASEQASGKSNLQLLSQRGCDLLEVSRVAPKQWGAFVPGVPDVSEFPCRVWAKLTSRYWRKPQVEHLSYSPGGGLTALRVALMNHLSAARSVQCEPQQIIITTGTHQSIDLTARLLASVGDTVWLEDPCYWGLRSTLTSLGMGIVPMPIDEEGMTWHSSSDLQKPKLVLVTPSHQYPLGMVMSLSRRQALLAQCQSQDAWIIEDDYDSEFRYDVRPLPCLQGLDSTGRVIYVGSFSKVLFPGLRIGYVVVPKSLAAYFAAGSAALYREGQLLQQAVLADFIQEGHLASHIRRMRILYQQRRELLLESIAHHFGNALAVQGSNAGLHIVLRLPDHTNDALLCDLALKEGIAVRPLSTYHAHTDRARCGLLLGYACVKPEDIVSNFSKLAQVIKSFL
jgi:GntR family transcriptional regulator / MocR family aminotransferase